MDSLNDDSIIENIYNYNIPRTYELQLYTIIDNKTYKDNQIEYDEHIDIIICFISLCDKIILLNKRFINTEQLCIMIPSVDEYINTLKPILNPLCIIDYDCTLKIKQTFTNLKYILYQCLHTINFVCFISNIKLVDMCNYAKLNTINDLNVNHTKICKIIITPIECCKHNHTF